jgi:hypothetical protein
MVGAQPETSQIHPNIPKAILMLIILYVILFILAQQNRIKKRFVVNFVSVFQETQDNVPIVRIRRSELGEDKLSQQVAFAQYNNKFGDINFFYLGQESEMESIEATKGTKVDISRKSFRIWVNQVDREAHEGQIGVDRGTWDALDNFLEGLPAQRRPHLKNAVFRVAVRAKIHGVRFLLRHHPDPIMRVTGWVTLLTGIFTICQGLVFS